MKKFPSPKKKASQLIEDYSKMFFIKNLFEAQCCALAFIKDVKEYSNGFEKVLVGNKYITIEKYLSLVEKEIEDYES